MSRHRRKRVRRRRIAARKRTVAIRKAEIIRWSDNRLHIAIAEES